MKAGTCRDLGPGTPPVVLIHGVAFGPSTLAPLVAALAPYGRVEVHARRGYGDRVHEPPALTVDEHVEDIFEVLDRGGIRRAVLAGMSGGATITLAAALACPERVVTAIAHEPAVGSVSPELRTLILDALGEGGGAGLARFLAGEETWATLPSALLRCLARSTALIERDAIAFARYEPRFPAPGTSIPLVCSLGERSGVARAEVAERLASRTGAPVAVVAGCGHLPQFDAPEAFATLIATKHRSSRED